MNIYAFSSFSAAFLLYGLAVFVYLNNRDRFLNAIYAIQCLVIGGWIWGCFGESVIKNYEFIVYWDKFLNVFAVFSPVLFLHTHYALIGKRADKIVKFLYGASVFLFSISFTPYYIKGVEFRYGVRYISDPGPLYILFIIYTSICLLFSLYNVREAMKWADHRKRLQLTYIFIASASMTTAAGIYLAMVFNIAISPLDNTLNAIYGILVAYAIVRHQLMDIEVIIKKTLVFTSLLVFVVAILVLPAVFLQEYIFRQATVPVKVFGLAISGIIIILSMRKIESILVNITDRYLFQKKYDYKELLKTFAGEVLTILDLNRLLELTVNKIADIMKLSSCAVFLLDDQKGKFILRAGKDIKDRSVELAASDAEDIKNRSDKSEKAVMEKLGSMLLIPLEHNGKLTGILSFGRKKSDADYSREDLDILYPLAGTLAIAISNAKLLKQIAKARAEASQKEKMATIGTLAAGMAHEIRNPITTIRTFADFLPEKAADEEFVATFNKLVPKEIDRVDNIARSLLEFSYTDCAKEAEVTDTAEVAKTVLTLVAPQYKFLASDIPCNIKGKADIRVNKGQIQEALFNIMKYVFSEAASPGSVSIEIEGDKRGVSMLINAKCLVVPAEVLEDVLEPVSKLSRARRGFGFSLFIAKQLIENNGGAFLI
ncbi:MAG: histidine kinase N-terminal 7TM domain-containing protein, partial [Candidatus Omnitrophica bacterium]|nr:histidine kinase N-terminal 7TM domain-containing protein [Candidatus Omnitrophota bacterium]